MAVDESVENGVSIQQISTFETTDPSGKVDRCQTIYQKRPIRS